MKRRKKLKLNNKMIAVLAIFLAVGFAYISSAVNIGGMFTLSPSRYDVHFENVQVTEGSVEADTPTYSTNDTKVSASIRFTQPGDFYEFTIDAVNDGDIDAMLNTVSDVELTEETDKYLDYKVTYEDGEELAQYQELNAGDRLTFKVRANFKENIATEDLPVDGDTLDLTFDTNYVKADDNRIKRRAENTLYNVLKEEAESGGLAKKYTGAHQDSMDALLSTKDIYSWKMTSTDEATSVLEKNNVIFANHCWKIIRTTDTGGTKIIYNGKAENGKCIKARSDKIIGYAGSPELNLASNYWYGTDYTYDYNNNVFSISGQKEEATWNDDTYQNLIGKYTCKSTSEDGSCSTLYLIESYNSAVKANTVTLITVSNAQSANYTQFGRVIYNRKNTSPAYVGYMYNKVHNFKNTRLYYKEELLKEASLSTSYWYADEVEWGNPVADKYNLVNPYQVSSTSEYSNLAGKYTFASTNQSQTSGMVRYISGVGGTYYYYIRVSNDTLYNDPDDVYTYGSSYTDNGNGTYTINSPSTLKRSEWYSKKSNINKKYVCKNATNNTCNDLWYVTSITNTNFMYILVGNEYKYGESFVYENGVYRLTGQTYTMWDIDTYSNYSKINNAHYTCWNTTGECTTLSYIYNKDMVNYRDFRSYELTDGKDIDDILNEMLYDDDVNSKDSVMKFAVDAWYKKYLLDYDNYIEDTIYCNDRGMKNSDQNGFNPNGGSIETRLYFNTSEELTCPNITDRFSINNAKAKLKYKVGLLNSGEVSLISFTTFYKTENDYWLMTPYYFSDTAVHGNIITFALGRIDERTIDSQYGVRPVISIAPNVFYTSGDGSTENPYVIYTE